MTSPHAAQPRSIPGRFSSILGLLLTASLAAPACGHEFWIEPTTFHPETGESVGVRLFVGDGFDNGSPYARNPRHLKSFFADTGARHPIPGVAGVEPAGSLVAGEAGSLIVGYESHANTLTLEAQRFESYLLDEGLSHIVDARRERGESALQGREGFSRAAKSLVSVSGGTAGGFDRRIGLVVEIVPLTDPFALNAGDALEVLVLRRGRPLADTQVRAFLRGRPEATFDSRTDGAGMASLPLAHHGTWLLSVVHMERAPAEADVDWLSTWSSLTFHRLSSAARAATAASNPREEHAE